MREDTRILVRVMNTFTEVMAMHWENVAEKMANQLPIHDGSSFRRLIAENKLRNEDITKKRSKKNV